MTPNVLEMFPADVLRGFLGFLGFLAFAMNALSLDAT